jgi:hypothetical protein
VHEVLFALAGGTLPKTINCIWPLKCQNLSDSTHPFPHVAQFFNLFVQLVFLGRLFLIDGASYRQIVRKLLAGEGFTTHEIGEANSLHRLSFGEFHLLLWCN